MEAPSKKTACTVARGLHTPETKRRVAARPAAVGSETSGIGQSGEGASPGGFSDQFRGGRRWLTTAEGS